MPWGNLRSCVTVGGATGSMAEAIGWWTPRVQAFAHSTDAAVTAHRFGAGGTRVWNLRPMRCTAWITVVLL